MSTENHAHKFADSDALDTEISNHLARYGGKSGFGAIYREGEGAASQESPATTGVALPAPFSGCTFVGTRPIARGGVGEVWLARNEAGVDVAIKRIPLNKWMGQVELTALDALKNIRHAHLLPFHYFAKRPIAGSEHEELLVVMEKADGSLAEQVKKGPTDAEEVLKFMEEAAEGLDYLHRCSHVHRDVKPGNLLLVGGSVKVADFGLAKQLNHNVVTHSKAAMTAPYAPPEWLDLEAKAGPRSDQYSLAISYVELRTGRHPFHARWGDELELKFAIMNGEFDLSDLEGAEAFAVRRALTKNPENRYDSCLAFVDAVRSAVKQDRQARAERAAPEMGEDVPDDGEDMSETIELGSANLEDLIQSTNDNPEARGFAMKAIKDLNFGYNDASNYGKEGERALLNRFFVKDADVARICAPEISFLVGEKGTGKTACATFLSGQEGKAAYGVLGKTLSIVANDYLAIQEATKTQQLPDSSCPDVWKTVLLLCLVDHLRNAVPHEKWSSELKSAAAFIDTFYSGSFRPEVSVALWLLTEPPVAARLAGESTKQPFSGSQTLLCILFLQKVLLSAVTTMQGTSTVALFIDGIDVRPPRMDYDEFLKVVEALVNAVVSLNDTVRNAQPLSRAKLLLLVRPDILDKVGMQNLNNRMRDNAVMLDWQTSYKNYRHSRLFRLADQMLASQQSEGLPSLETGCWWDKYFPYSAWNKGKLSDPSFVPFLRYSFYRPRDVITYLGEMQRNKVDRGDGANTSFSLQDFSDRTVARKYSDYLLGEVKDGLLFHHPAADFDLFVKFFTSYLRPAMGAGESNEFDYRTFLKAYEQFRKYLDSNQLNPGVIFQSADVFLQFLYELNIICYLERAGQSPKQLYHWCFKERTYANIRPKVRSQQTYMMHYGIARALKQA